MRPTFVLTRVFAASALLVGVAQVAHGAPILARDQPVVAVAIGAEGANVAREIPPAVDWKLALANTRANVNTRSAEAGSVDILKRMCLMVWACK